MVWHTSYHKMVYCGIIATSVLVSMDSQNKIKSMFSEMCNTVDPICAKLSG